MDSSKKDLFFTSDKRKILEKFLKTLTRCCSVEQQISEQCRLNVNALADSAVC